MSQCDEIPWYMKENWPDFINEARVSDELKKLATEFAENGFVIVKGANDKSLCKETIKDYHRYVDQNGPYVSQNLDVHGREKRLVNFHLWSDSAMVIGTNEYIMNLLDFIFCCEASVYTSLTFKYGTQQPVHRDTPHFATWPRGYFVGMWCALEDIDPLAGPLFYFPKSHRLTIEESVFWKKAQKLYSDESRAVQLERALDLYNGEVIRLAENIGDRKRAVLEAGDVAIWHPETMHGGTVADDVYRTRWSIVFHCAPQARQVHQHDRFFGHPINQTPSDRYGYFMANNRKIAVSGDVAYM